MTAVSIFVYNSDLIYLRDDKFIFCIVVTEDCKLDCSYKLKKKKKLSMRAKCISALSIVFLTCRVLKRQKLALYINVHVMLKI